MAADHQEGGATTSLLRRQQTCTKPSHLPPPKIVGLGGINLRGRENTLRIFRKIVFQRTSATTPTSHCLGARSNTVNRARVCRRRVLSLGHSLG